MNTYAECTHRLLTVTFNFNADLLNTNDIREVLDEMWNYRARWRFIGIELGIDTGTLDAIEANYRKVEDCLCEMINVWLRCINPKPTKSAMKTALESEHVLGAKGNNLYMHDSVDMVMCAAILYVMIGHTSCIRVQFL